MKDINMDEIRLDRLSDPSFKFSFSITAEGKGHISEPCEAILDNLRSAIDYVRCKNKEVPFCIKCKKSLNEMNHTETDGIGQRRKFTCPDCETSFFE